MNSDIKVGNIINGRYEILQHLGEGGFATVFKALDRELGREVAVKFLKLNHLDSEDQARFRREAKLLAKMAQRNIVTVYSYDLVEDSSPFIVMEYLQGRNLRSLLRESGGLSMQLCCDVLGQVCSGLAYIHQQGFVHRDLSPDNIFLTGDAPPYAVKLIDFGLSRVLAETSSSAKLTKTGLLVGNPPYMSPELARGGAVDSRSDIYAFGCILYEVLCGRVPLDAENLIGVLFLQQNQYPLEPKFDWPDKALQAKYKLLALRCLQKEPLKRFQSSEELLAAINAEWSDGLLESYADKFALHGWDDSKNDVLSKKIAGKVFVIAAFLSCILVLVIAFFVYTKRPQAKVGVSGEQLAPAESIHIPLHSVDIGDLLIKYRSRYGYSSVDVLVNRWEKKYTSLSTRENLIDAYARFVLIYTQEENVEKAELYLNKMFDVTLVPSGPFYESTRELLSLYSKKGLATKGLSFLSKVRKKFPSIKEAGEDFVLSYEAECYFDLLQYQKAVGCIQLMSYPAFLHVLEKLDTSLWKNGNSPQVLSFLHSSPHMISEMRKVSPILKVELIAVLAKNIARRPSLLSAEDAECFAREMLKELKQPEVKCENNGFATLSYAMRNIAVLLFYFDHKKSAFEFVRAFRDEMSKKSAANAVRLSALDSFIWLTLDYPDLGSLDDIQKAADEFDALLGKNGFHFGDGGANLITNTSGRLYAVFVKMNQKDKAADVSRKYSQVMRENHIFDVGHKMTYLDIVCSVWEKKFPDEAEFNSAKMQLLESMAESTKADEGVILQVSSVALRLANCLIVNHRYKDALAFLQESLEILVKNKKCAYIPKLVLLPPIVDLGLETKSLSNSDLRFDLDTFIDASPMPALVNEAGSVGELARVLEKYKRNDELHDYWNRMAEMIKGRKDLFSVKLDVLVYMMALESDVSLLKSNAEKALFLKSQIFDILSKGNNDEILADSNLFSNNIRAIGNQMAWSFGNEAGLKYYQEILALFKSKECKLHPSQELFLLSQELFYSDKEAWKSPLMQKVEALANTTGMDKEAQAEALRVIATAYMKAGLLDKADPYFEQSAKIFLSVAKPSVAKLALEQRAVLYDQKGQPELAEKYYLLALEQILALTEPKDIDIWIGALLTELKKSPKHSHLVEQITLNRDHYPELRRLSAAESLKF